MKISSYTTRQDDTLLKIANMFYFRFDLWPLIYYYNSESIGDNPNSLPSGVQLLIPIPPVTDDRYVVDTEDSSYSLAEKFYGERELYYIIDKSNNFEPLTAGDEIIIPALCSQLELDAASDIRRQLNVL